MAEKLSDLLLIFRTVVDSESFSAAGRRLNMSPAWVAKQVTRLEAQLETALLIRSTRLLRLTEAGQECYRTAGVVSDELNALKEKLHAETNLISGTLRINVPSIAALEILPRHFKAFQQEFPNLKLDVTVSDSFVDVLNEDTDLVFRVTHELTDSTAIVQRIGSVSRIVCASKEYLTSAPEIQTLQDILNHKALVFTNSINRSSWHLRHEGKEEWVSPAATMQANNSYVLRGAAIDGTGIAFLPEPMIETELKQGKLIALPMFEDASPFGLYMLRAPQKHLPKRILVAWSFFSKAAIG